jgi:hypothetical protein
MASGSRPADLNSKKDSMSRLRLLARAAVRNPGPVLWQIAKTLGAAALLYIVVAAAIFNLSHGLFTPLSNVLLFGFFALGMLVGLIQFVYEARIAIRDYLRPIADQAEGPGFMPYHSIEAYDKSRETDRYGNLVLF